MTARAPARADDTSSADRASPAKGVDQVGLLKAVRPSRERAHGQSATDGLFDGERADPGGRAHYQKRRAQLSMSS